MTLIREIKASPHFFLLRRMPPNHPIHVDIRRWINALNISKTSKNESVLPYLLGHHEAFRNLFYYRLKSLKTHPMFYLARLIYPPMESLKIAARTIGPGLFIQHGIASLIGGISIGENCWINQQVTIGYSAPGKAPTIGNDVTIFAGAKIIGDIHIGDHSVICANAVVSKNIPEYSTVVGNPGRILPGGWRG